MSMGLQGMTRCVESPEMMALEQQRSKLLNWRDLKGADLFQQQAESLSSFGSRFDGVGGRGSPSPFSPGSENSTWLGEVVKQYNVIDPSPRTERWGQVGKIELPCTGFRGGIGNASPSPSSSSSSSSSSGCKISCGGISRTGGCLPMAPVTAAGGRFAEGAVTAEKVSASVGKDSFTKRKLESVQCTEGYEEKMRDKKTKGCSDDTEQSNNNNSENKKITKNSNNDRKEGSASSSKDNSKTSEVQKPDYIHVRARRGQATDSHSLAERVRREKINQRMKFLQDLVPGCNKVTGRAAMLDEIIHYVQSLQRQVEFLSMKVATEIPRLDLDSDMDSLFPKETNPACTSSFSTINMSPELTEPTHLHLDPMQQVVSCSGLDMGAMNPDIGLQGTITGPAPIPEPLIDPSRSCLAQLLPMASWDTDLQNLCNMEFEQGTAAAAAYQSLQQCMGD